MTPRAFAAMEETIRSLNESCDGWRDRAGHWREKAESLDVRVKELLSEREKQAVLIKRLQDENAEMRAHPLFAAPPPSVADRIVMSPEFRDFVVTVSMTTDNPLSRLAGQLVDLLDREVKR